MEDYLRTLVETICQDHMIGGSEVDHVYDAVVERLKLEPDADATRIEEIVREEIQRFIT